MIQICSECSGTEIDCSIRRCWGFVNGKRKDAPASRVIFPQPEVEAPKDGDKYFYISSDGSVIGDAWNSHYEFDKDRLSIGNVYLTEAEAKQRIAWNRQDMAKRVIPKWFRDLGPDVEFMFARKWQDFDASTVTDWSELSPADFRAKPKPAPDFVVTVNGREYRWPATVREGEPSGERYIVVENRRICYVVRFADTSNSGRFVHHTREGAEAQCAALNAALGIEQGGAA